MEVILIKNGCIIDGTGNPWFKADIMVKDGRIISVGRRVHQREACKIVHADGLVVSPGFIDIHNHGDQFPGEGAARG